MEKLDKKRKNSLTQRVNEQMEKIIYQVMTNEGLEQTIARAVQKSLISLVRRYWLLIVIGVLALLLLQSLFFSLALRWLVEQKALNIN